MIQVENRTDFEQVVVLNGKPWSRIWRGKRRGLYLCAGRFALGPHDGGWIDLSTVVAAGHAFHSRKRLLVRISGRVGQSGKRMGFTGFARLLRARSAACRPVAMRPARSRFPCSW